MQSSITTWLRKHEASKPSEESSTVPVVLPRTSSKIDDSPGLASAKLAQGPTLNDQLRKSMQDDLKHRKDLGPPLQVPPRPSPRLPENVEFAPLSDEILPGFKRLNALLFPISYPNTFYSESMQEPFHSITLMALWRPAAFDSTNMKAYQTPQVVGAIRCRLLSSAILYISTIGLLAPYRSLGIASHLLQRVVLKAVEQHHVKSVTAHVWEANDEGLEWYTKQGFEVIAKEDGYYRKLRPSGAVLVQKWIRVEDLLPG